MQATPTPRYVETPIDVPDFERVSDAECFLAKLPVLVARGLLDFQSAQELCAMTKLWIDSQNTRTELDIKAINAGTTEHEQVIRVEGGLPVMPGLEGVVMPQLNGHATNGPDVLAPPVPQIESSSPESESVVPPTNGQGSGPGSHLPQNAAPETNDQGPT
jgi:hypothetical protein